MNYSDVRLSPHFKLSEFLNLEKYPENIPSMQDVVNLTYGCHQLLEPARMIVGPIIINSGYRNAEVNRKVGGVKNSQHLLGQAADIRPKDPDEFQRLIEFFKFICYLVMIIIIYWSICYCYIYVSCYCSSYFCYI